MAEINLRCRYCLGTNTVDEKVLEAGLITCKYCREKLAITDFESKQLEYKQKLEEGEKAKQALAEAEKALKAEQEKVWKIISDMDGLKGSLEEQEQQLGEILKASQADQETQETILSLLRAMNQDQAQGKTSILTLLGRIADGQDTAQGKLSAIQTATAVLTEGHADISKAISEITDLLHADIAQKNQATHELLSWFNNRNEEEQERLKQLNTISMTLLNGQEKSAAEISSLRKTAEETQKTLESLARKIDQQNQEKLVNLYHLAENLQRDMIFDKAEDEYRKVIVNGGKDPEVYWRIILCHYGVVYQKDNEGNRIPTILRPDLSPAFSAVQELESSCRTPEECEYYTAELERINGLLEKYRQYRMTDQYDQYDVFISVKQKILINGQETPTNDCLIGSRLYRHLTEMGLRVFNSEENDCKKPAEEWEPYILAALLSSRVMIVVGTSKDNMESPWVQNEWQRFQWLRKDEEKTGRTDRKLLCFIKNMTAKDLPLGLEPIQAIIDEAGAYQLLDKALLRCFPDLGKQPEKAGSAERQSQTELPVQSAEEYAAEEEAGFLISAQHYLAEAEKKDQGNSRTEMTEAVADMLLRIDSTLKDDGNRDKYISEVMKWKELALGSGYKSINRILTLFTVVLVILVLGALIFHSYAGGFYHHAECPVDEALTGAAFPFNTFLSAGKWFCGLLKPFGTDGFIALHSENCASILVLYDIIGAFVVLFLPALLIITAVWNGKRERRTEAAEEKRNTFGRLLNKADDRANVIVKIEKTKQLWEGIGNRLAAASAIAVSLFSLVYQSSISSDYTLAGILRLTFSGVVPGVLIWFGIILLFNLLAPFFWKQVMAGYNENIRKWDRSYLNRQ